MFQHNMAVYTKLLHVAWQLLCKTGDQDVGLYGYTATLRDERAAAPCAPTISCLPHLNKKVTSKQQFLCLVDTQPTPCRVRTFLGK